MNSSRSSLGEKVERAIAFIAGLGPWPFILLAIVDRAILTGLFGSRYVSTDDAIIWSAAVDYGQGLFRGPYYYGQNYGPMLEALVAAPFTRLGLSMFWLMPAVSSLLALLPYWSFSLWHHRHGRHKAALLFALLPLLMPVEFGMMTTLPRGFITGLAPLALLPWILDVRRPWLRSALTGLVVASAWAINPNSVIFSVAYLVWYLLASVRPIVQTGLVVLGALPALLAHLSAQAWCLEHADRLIHRLEQALPTFDLPRILESIQNLDAHFRWLMPVVWPLPQLLALGLLALVLFTFRERRMALALGLLASLFVILASFTMDKVHDGWGTVFYPLSRMFLGLPLLLCWASAMLLRPGRLFSLGVFGILLIAVGFVGLRTSQTDRVARWNIHAQRDWVGVLPGDFLRSDAQRIHGISKRHGVGLIVPLPVPSLVWPQFRGYLYPVLEPELPPTYVHSNERRYWQRETFQNATVPVILFTGGDPERWNTILALDDRFIAVHDGGPDAVHVLVGNTLPADSIVRTVLDALNAH